MQSRARSYWPMVRDLADAQDGLVTRRQLLELGIPPSVIRDRAALGGAWQRALPGVYLVGGRLGLDQRDRAAMLYAGAGGVLTGLSALRRRGIRAAAGVDESVSHVLLPADSRRTSRRFLQIERTIRLPEAEQIGGWVVANPARSAIDATRRMGRRDRTRALLAEVVQRGMATPEQLADELSAAQRRGSALAREAVAGILAGGRSAPELDLRDLVLSSRLPEPLWNPTILLPNGLFLAEPDGYYEDLGIALEADSREFHFSEADWQRTMARHARMTAAGLIVLHFTPQRIWTQGSEVVRTIADAVDAHAGRPAPRVILKRAA